MLQRPNVELLLKTEPNIRAEQALKRAREEDHASALTLADSIDQSKLQHPGRTHLARTYLMLGKPTDAISTLRLQDQVTPKQLVDIGLDTDINYLRTVLQSLLATGRTEEADNLGKTLLPDTEKIDDFETLLAIAEARNAIGWKEGAAELLDKFENNPVRYKLSPENTWEMDLLRAKLSHARGELRLPARLQRVLDESPVSPSTRNLQARTLLLVAKQHLDRQEWSEAQAVLLRIIDSYAHAGRENHQWAIHAKHMLGVVFQSQDNGEEQNRWFRRTWQSIEDEEEFGTRIAAHTVGQLFRYGQPDEVKTAIQKLHSFRWSYESDPYLFRDILAPQIRSAIARKDWRKALETSARFRALELKLWGENSLPYAYALALNVFVRQSQKLESSKDEQSLTKAVQHILKSDPDCPAKIFLRLAIQSEDQSMAQHEWVHLYSMHRSNTEADQRAMIQHICQEVGEDSRDGRTLAAAL